MPGLWVVMLGTAELAHERAECSQISMEIRTEMFQAVCLKAQTWGKQHFNAMW